LPPVARSQLSVLNLSSSAGSTGDDSDCDVEDPTCDLA